MATLADYVRNLLEPGAQRVRDMIASAVVTQGFGPTSLGLEPPYAGYPHFHEGVDLAWNGQNKQNIFSPAAGTIVTAGFTHNGLGNEVAIQTADGYLIKLGHLFSINVHAGDQVSIGDLLGVEGSTGASTGPHLHIQISRTSGGIGPLHLINPSGTGYGDNNPGDIVSTLYNIFGWEGTPRPIPGPQPSPGPASCPVHYHWDATVNRCVADGGGVIGTQCGDGYHWDEQAGICVPNGSGISLDPATWIAAIQQALANAVPVIGETLRNNILPPLALVSIGGILVLVGLIKLTGEKPVQAVVQPVQDLGGKAAKAGATVAALA